MARPYREVRKDYISARHGEILLAFRGRGSRRDAKEAACLEFDEFVHQERQKAVNGALALLRATPETEGPNT